MAGPYTITAVNDIPLSDRIDDLLTGRRGRVVAEASLVEIALNVEDVDVTVGVTIGAIDALSAGSRVTLQATIGVMPIFPDDAIIRTFADAKDEIIISAVNADAAAAREVRAVVRVTPIDDVMLMNAVKAQQQSQSS